MTVTNTHLNRVLAPKLLLAFAAIAFCQPTLAADPSIATGRHLISPMMRLRADVTRAGWCQKDIFDVGWPRDCIKDSVVTKFNALTRLTIRYRVELSNISTTEAQDVTVSLRGGSYGGLGIPGTVLVDTNATRLGSSEVLSKVRLEPLQVGVGLADNSSSKSIFVDFTCDLTAKTCKFSCSIPVGDDDESGAACNGSLGRTYTFTAEPTALSPLKLSGQLAVALDFVVAQDTGAITGRVGSIINTNDAYPFHAQGSSGDIPLNGGRPF